MTHIMKPTVTVAFRLSQSERRQLRDLAVTQNNTISRLVRRIIAEHLQKENSK